MPSILFTSLSVLYAQQTKYASESAGVAKVEVGPRSRESELEL